MHTSPELVFAHFSLYSKNLCRFILWCLGTISIRTLLIIISLGSFSFAEISEKEKKVLEDYNKIALSLPVDNVDILTPPRGAYDDDLRVQKRQIENMIEELAGEELRQKGVNFFVTINSEEFPSVDLNRFTSSADKKYMQEYGFETEWPIHKWLKMPPNRDYYNFSVSIGTLRLAKNKAQLAFLLAREITQLLQEPKYNLDATGKQRSVLVFDREAVDMMLGKYDIRESLHAVNKLAQKFTQKGEEFGKYQSFSDSQPHEGVRVGTLQSYIEFLTRSESSAEIFKSSHSDYAPYKEGHYSSYEDKGGFSKNINQSLEFVTQNFIKKNGEKFAIPNERPDLVGTYNFHYPKATEFQLYFRWFLEKLGKETQIKAQEKMDRMFSWLGFYGNYNIVNSQVLQLTSQDRIAVFRFLKNQLKQGATIDRSFSRLSQVRSSSGSPSAAIHIDDFFLEPTMQKTFESMARVSPIMVEKLVNQWLSGNIEYANSRGAPWSHLSLKSYILKLNPEETNSENELNNKYPIYRGIVRQALMTWVSSDKYYEIIKNTKTAAPTSYLRLTLDNFELLEKHQLTNQERRTLEKLTEDFSDFRQDLIIKISNNGFASDQIDLLQDSFGKHAPKLRASELQILAPAFAKIAESTFYGNSLPEVGLFSMHGNDGLMKVIGSLLEHEHTKPRHKFLLVKYLAYKLESLRSLPNETLEDIKLRDAIASTIKKLNVSDFKTLLFLTSKSQEQYLKGVYSSQRVQDALKEYKVARALEDASLDEWRKNGSKGNPPIDFKYIIKFSGMPEMEKAINFEDYRINSFISFLGFMELDRVTAERLAKELDFKDLKQILDRALAISWEGKKPSTIWVVNNLERPQNRINSQAGLFLFRLLAENGKNASLHNWLSVLSKLQARVSSSIDIYPGIREKLQQEFSHKVSLLNASELYRTLKKQAVVNLLDASQLTAYLLPYLEVRFQSLRTESEKSQAVVKVLDDLKLENLHPDKYRHVRSEIASHFQLQPSEISSYFPQLKGNLLKRSNTFSLDTRAFSTLVSLTRKQSPEDQLRTIRYFTGINKIYPEFLNEAARELDQGVPVTTIIRELRDKMLSADIYERTFFVNAFLAGSSGLSQSQSGVEFLLNELLSPVDPENREFALKLARATLRAEGLSSSLDIAYVIAQEKPEIETGKKTKQADLLKAVFEARGVPGIKLGQYLAFTAKNPEFKNSLADLQDIAMPLTYFDAIMLVKKRLGDKWPNRLKILGVLGSGSVNVAIEYYHQGRLKEEVLTILREDIEVRTNEEFRSLEAIVNELTNTPEGLKEFGYLLGLLQIIKRSVELEFEKKNAFEVQASLKKFYARKMGSWSMQTLDVHSYNDSAVFMDKAKGKTAKKIYESNPSLYRDVMSKVSQLELDMLFGVDERGRPHPVPLFANPDIHDGQVLIDEERRVATVLDFGQALPITNEERDLAIEFLRIISKSVSSGQAVRILQNISGIKDITKFEINTLFRSYNDRMDLFIHLLSLVERKGYEVPLTSIHWILGLNRQIVLAEKLGKPINWNIIRLMLLRKIGLGLHSHNNINLFGRKLMKYWEQTTQLKCKAIFK